MDRLQQAWLDTLQVDACTDEDHFFELGGDSFGALALLAQV